MSIRESKPLNTRVKISVVCDDADVSLAEECVHHLRPYFHPDGAEFWTPVHTLPGDSRVNSVVRAIRDADVVIVFIASGWWSEQSLGYLLAVQEREEAAGWIIPVLLRPSWYPEEMFHKLRGIPRNRKPVILWRHRSKAWVELGQALTDIFKGTFFHASLAAFGGKSPDSSDGSPQATLHRPWSRGLAVYISFVVSLTLALALIGYTHMIVDREPALIDGNQMLVDFDSENDAAYAVLRRGPSRLTDDIAQVPRGATVTLLGPSRLDEGSDAGRWYYVSFEGRTGWLHEHSLRRK